MLDLCTTVQNLNQWCSLCQQLGVEGTKGGGAEDDKDEDDNGGDVLLQWRRRSVTAGQRRCPFVIAMARSYCDSGDEVLLQW